MKANFVPQETPIVIYADKKPVLLFRSGHLGGMYISKESDIKKKNLSSYAHGKRSISKGYNRYDKKLAVRYATIEQIKLLGKNRIVVLDAGFRNCAYMEGVPGDGGGYDIQCGGKPAKYKEEEVEKIIKAVENWKEKRKAELRRITGIPLVHINKLFEKEFEDQLAYKKDYNIRKRIIKGSVKTALKYIDKIDVIKIMNELIDELKEADDK